MSDLNKEKEYLELLINLKAIINDPLKNLEGIKRIIAQLITNVQTKILSNDQIFRKSKSYIEFFINNLSRLLINLDDANQLRREAIREIESLYHYILQSESELGSELESELKSESPSSSPSELESELESKSESSSQLQSSPSQLQSESKLPSPSQLQLESKLPLGKIFKNENNLEKKPLETITQKTNNSNINLYHLIPNDSNISNPKVKEIANILRNIIKTVKENKPILKDDLDKFRNLEQEINNIKSGGKLGKDRIILNDLENIYNDIKRNILTHFDENKELVNESKIIIDFKDTASFFTMLIKYLLLFCIFIFIIVFLISLLNIINLSYLCIKYTINLFYNKTIINNDTLSFKLKNITKISKNDFSNDVTNVLNEQLTALSVFNMTTYIFYILFAYVIIYILYYFYYNYVMEYTHKLIGSITDIDPDADYMKLIFLIFALSIVHILIYRLLFKNVGINQYKKINEFEINIENIIFKNYINNFPLNPSEDEQFYTLLKDSTKYDELNLFFENKINYSTKEENNIGKYIFIYDLYRYFSEYIFMNDINEYKIGNYLTLIKKNDNNNNDTEKLTFISLLDTNNKRLIKLYHEELMFYKNIPKNKIEIFKTINNEIITNIASINKLIINYNGTFLPFIVICIYIIIIFLYNALVLYLLFDAIHETESKNMFPPFIYRITTMYKNFINKLLDRE